MGYIYELVLRNHLIYLNQIMHSRVDLYQTCNFCAELKSKMTIHFITSFRLICSLPIYMRWRIHRSSGSFGHCVVCPSVYNFCLPLWYHQTFLLIKNLLNPHWYLQTFLLIKNLLNPHWYLQTFLLIKNLLNPHCAWKKMVSCKVYILF